MKIISDSRVLEGDAVPKVSIIVPVYNVENYVRDCLLSILAAARLVRLEIIIIDDGSADGSAGIVQSLLKAYAHTETLFAQQENRGLSAVRNLGVSLARGEYIGFLDSDDFILPLGLQKLVEYADARSCDLVLGRTLVFDSRNNGVQRFFDAEIWETLLDGAGERIVAGGAEPLMFCLEPNANYRLIRRCFYLEKGLSYPEGHLFEDPPVHFKMLASAHRIGLVDVPYYWYRVNRPGKITNEKSVRRFDTLEVAKQALYNLKECRVDAEQGGAALYGLFGITWWSGTMCRPGHKAEFFDKACTLFTSEIPPSWGQAYLRQNFRDKRRFIIGAGFLYNRPRLLKSLAFQKRKLVSLTLFLIGTGQWKFLFRLGSQYPRRLLRVFLGRRPAEARG